MAQADDGEDGDDDTVEATAVRKRRAPIQPTAEMVDEHELSGHAVFRDWCAHCVASWGLPGQQRTVDHGSDEIPTVHSDFFFMGDEEDDEDTKALPMLAMYDSRSTVVSAATLPSKAASLPYNVRTFGRFFQKLGYDHVVNKSDGEPAMVALKGNAAKYCKGLQAVLRESPPGDHKANGTIENVIKELKRRIRANKSTLEAKLGMLVDSDDPALAFLPSYSADQMTRHRVGKDGRTAIQRLTGRQWKRHSVHFGEKISTLR